MIEQVKLLLQNNQEVVIGRDEEHYILDYIDYGVVVGTFENQEYSGFNTNYSALTKVQNRSLEVVGWVTANESEFKQVKMSFGNMFAVGSEVRLEVGQYYIDGKFIESINYSKEIGQENESIITKFKLKISCDDPMFKKKSLEKFIFNKDDSQFHFPVVWNKKQMINQVEVTKQVLGVKRYKDKLYLQNYEALPLPLEFVFNFFNSIDELSVKILTLDKFFKVNNFSAGVGFALKVNTQNSMRLCELITPQGKLINLKALVDENSDWLQLEPGKNVFSIEVVSKNGHNIQTTTTISYRKKLYEVE